MSATCPLPRANAILDAVRFDETFVQDIDHDDFWSICAGHHEPLIPVQRHTSDGWVAAVFHRGYGYIKIVDPGETIFLPRNQTVVARIHRQGVRWEFANPPS